MAVGRVLTEFIQTNLVTAMLIKNLEDRLVSRSVISMATQTRLGEASSYKIPGVSSFTVEDYDGTALTEQAPVDKVATISVDQCKAVLFDLERVDRKEAAENLVAAFTRQQSFDIAHAIDADLFADIFSGATTNAGAGVTTSPIAIDSTNAMEYIETLATLAGEANIFSRKMVIPEFLANAIVAELGTTSSNQNLSGAVVPGFVTRLYDFDIYKSNNTPKKGDTGTAATEYSVLFGDPTTYHAVLGLGDYATDQNKLKISDWHRLAQWYGRGFSNSAGWYSGVITKA